MGGSRRGISAFSPDFNSGVFLPGTTHRGVKLETWNDRWVVLVFLGCRFG